MKKKAPLKEDLEILLEQSKSKSALSIEEILNILSGKGRALLLIFLSLPFCQPIQIPGVSTPFGIAIIFIGLRMAFGKHIWLPQKVLSQTISSKMIQKVTHNSLKVLKKLKRFIHPRLSWLSENEIMQVINGLLIVLLGIVLALPLPIPLSNLAVGWPIFLLGIGLLENDGVFVIIGYLASLLAVVFFMAILFSIKSFF